MHEKSRRLAIIGAGSMGQALTRGLIAAGLYSPREIIVSDIDKANLERLSNETGISAAGNIEAASNSGTIILAVYPQVVPDVLDEIASYVNTDQLIISIAAGVQTRKIEAKLKGEIPVIRTMPNIACLVGEGASAIARGKYANRSHAEKAMAIFGAVGKVIEVPEKLINAVTGLSGSAPAYIYVAIEALADAGVKAGLNRRQSSLLAAQTVLGAAKMVLETGKHPGELKDLVASPGGTTIMGLSALEHAGFRAALIDAVELASNKAAELSPMTPENGNSEKQ